MKPILYVLLALVVSPLPALAQFETASVTGTVRDVSGAIVPDATVTLTSTGTGISSTRTTNAEGIYEFFTVRIGAYVVTAEKAGFAIALVENVQVQVSARLRVDLQMAPGQVSERIQVTANAPLLETDSSQRGLVVTADQIAAIPLNGREYSALALGSPGVRLSALNTGGATPREGSFNVNGLRSTFNNFLIDGLDNNAYGTSNQGFSNQVMQPPPDAIGEFRILTNNVSAEYGRAAGATINVVYRSGTNQFHGNGWEFLRATPLNATGFFRPASGEKPPLRRDQFGAVAGGPLVRNNAFFFADFEGFRQNRKSTLLQTIPTAAQRSGILPVAVRDPRTGIVYAAGTQIPMTAFAATVLGGIPDPTNANAASNSVIAQEFDNVTNKAGGKIDLRVSPSLSVSGRFGWRDLSTDDQPPLPLPSGGGGNGNIYAKNKQFAAGMTLITGRNSLLEARFGWSGTEGGKNPPALGSESALSAYGIAGLPADERIAGGLPTQVITGFAELGRQATNPQWQYPVVYNPKINYAWSTGRHSIKTGYEFQRIETEVQDVNPLYGRDTYSGQFSRPSGAAAHNLYNLADFMLGLRSRYELSNVLVANLRQHMHFLYVQDDLRLTDRLTLNLGLRYEYATPHWEADNVLSNYDPAANAIVAARDGSLSERALIDPDRNNIGPRIGFAYSADPRTVVRGGYGVGYVHFHRAGGANILPINGPQVVNAVVNQTPTDAAFRPTEQGYPQGLTDSSRFNPLAANVTFMPRDYQSSRVQGWYVEVQREIGANMVVDLAYVGNRADGMLLFANYNQAAPNNSAGTLSLASRRPIPQFGDITYSFNGGKSRYRSLQMRYEWRAARALTLVSTLTLSETKDNGAGSLENPNGNNPSPQNFYDLDAEFGLSGYHQPYKSSTSFVWSLPIGRGQRWLGDAGRAMDLLVGGWQLAGTNTITPGEPATLTYTAPAAFQVSGVSADFRGANNYRPNVTGDPYAPGGQQTITNWFDKTHVAAPTDPSQPFGNAARNSVRGPNFWQVDLAASKRFPLGGTTQFEFRLEAFNLFNRTNFRAPNANVSLANFGTITATYDPRQLQLGFKLLW